jgi:NADH-quinone oxidoreductase subunit H
MRFGLFFLAEYLSVFSVSCLGTILFLGGGSLPFLDFPRALLTDTRMSFLIVNSITVGIFSLKLVGYIFLMFWIRVTLPRLRVDQLMGFAWKMMVPLAILNIVIAAIWQEVVVGHNLDYLPTLSDKIMGWAVTGPIVLVSILLIFKLNRMSREETAPALASARRQTVAVVR